MRFGDVWDKLSQQFQQPSQTSKIELFAIIVNGFQPLIIFAKNSILDVPLGSENATD